MEALPVVFGNINLFSGSYSFGTTGDSGPATSAKFKSISAVAGNSNNVYVLDGMNMNNGLIRYVASPFRRVLFRLVAVGQ